MLGEEDKVFIVDYFLHAVFMAWLKQLDILNLVFVLLLEVVLTCLIEEAHAHTPLIPELLFQHVECLLFMQVFVDIGLDAWVLVEDGEDCIALFFI